LQDDRQNFDVRFLGCLQIHSAVDESATTAMNVRLRILPCYFPRRGLESFRLLSSCRHRSALSIPVFHPRTFPVPRTDPGFVPRQCHTEFYFPGVDAPIDLGEPVVPPRTYGVKSMDQFCRLNDCICQGVPTRCHVVVNKFVNDASAVWACLSQYSNFSRHQVKSVGCEAVNLCACEV
jgi:hypothetical protein